MSDLYMHMLDDSPAYWERNHIVFAGKRVRVLATSLEQIRREQQLDTAWCARHEVSPCRYSYIRIAR